MGNFIPVSNTIWSNDSRSLYFKWNPEKAGRFIVLYQYRQPYSGKSKFAAGSGYQQHRQPGVAIKTRSAYVYSKDGDIFYTEIKTGKTNTTQTTDAEPKSRFSFNSTKIVYTRCKNYLRGILPVAKPSS